MRLREHRGELRSFGDRCRAPRIATTRLAIAGRRLEARKRDEIEGDAFRNLQFPIDVERGEQSSARLVDASSPGLDLTQQPPGVCFPAALCRGLRQPGSRAP